MPNPVRDERLNLAPEEVPLQFLSIEKVTDKSNIAVIGKAKSRFYNTETLICDAFYKHISRLFKRNEI